MGDRKPCRMFGPVPAMLLLGHGVFVGSWVFNVSWGSLCGHAETFRGRFLCSYFCQHWDPGGFSLEVVWEVLHWELQTKDNFSHASWWPDVSCAVFMGVGPIGVHEKVREPRLVQPNGYHFLFQCCQRHGCSSFSLVLHTCFYLNCSILGKAAMLKVTLRSLLERALGKEFIS